MHNDPTSDSFSPETKDILPNKIRSSEKGSSSSNQSQIHGSNQSQIHGSIRKTLTRA
jgi:hypothetical protein